MTEPEAEAEPVTFEGEAGGIKVIVEAAADAFPEGTTMAVEAVRAGDVRDAVEQAVEGKVARVAAVDITFADAEGAEVQPASPVKVSMSGVDVPSQGEPVVVHLDPEGQGSLVEQAEAEQAEVAFEAESFSVYAVAVIWDEEGELVVETDDYVVTVGYTKEAEIPFGTELEVREIERGSDRYDDLWDQTVDKLNEGVAWDNHDLPDPRKGLTDAMFFDVTLRLRDQVIEPKVPLQVSIRYKDGGVLLPEGENAGVVHFGERGTEIVEGVDVDSTAADDKHLPNTLKGSDLATGFSCELDGFSPVGTFGTGSLGEGTVSGPAIKLMAANEPSTAISASKTITDDDHDGVYELALSVTGASESSSSTKVDKSNVVIIIDRSGSMQTNYTYTPYTYSADTYSSSTTYYRNTSGNTVWHWPGGNYGTYRPQYHAEGWYYGSYGQFNTAYSGTVYTRQTRMEATKAAAKDLVSVLLSNNKPAGTVAEDGTRLDDIIEISLISFAGNTTYEGSTSINDATIHQPEKSTNESTLHSVIDGLTADGGTNWEAALRRAMTAANAYQDGDPTSIIFLTDGMPTFYLNNADSRRAGQGGTGSDNANNVQNVRNSWTYAKDDARALVTAGYKLYNIFAFGSTAAYDGNRTPSDFLKALTNYAYKTGNGDYTDTETNQYTRDYFYDAKDTQALTDAFQKIINSINNTVGYGGVEYDDGVTLGVTNTSVAIDGQTHEDTFRYVVRNANGDIIYSVKIDAEGKATFTINGATYTDDEPEDVVTKPDPDVQSTWITSQVYSVEVGGKKYMMSAAEIDPDTGMIEWDLAGLGILENGYTYTVAFDVWPNQWSYDLVADLNNGVKTKAQAEAEVIAMRKAAGDTQEEAEAYWQRIEDALIGPDANNQYSVKTNYHQKVDYYTVETTQTDDGEPVTTYSDKKTKDVPFTSEIALTSKPIPMVKVWNSSLSPDQIGNILYEDYPANQVPTEYHVTLHLWKADTATELQDLIDQYAGDPATASQHDYIDKTLGWNGTTYDWDDSVSISPGTMVKLTTAQDMGIPIDNKNVVTYSGTQYYIIETGHYYYVTEDNIDWHFELETVLYHPMLVDGTLSNVTFITDAQGNITGVEDIEDMTQVSATNSKTAELDITKRISDPNNALTQAQEDAETFTYKVTLTVPADADMSHTNLLEWVPRYNDDVSASNRYYIYGYQTSEAAELLGFEDDVTKFNGKVYGQYTVSYPGGGATLNEMFTPENGVTVNQDGTLTNSIYVTLKQNEVIRLTNLPSGTQYEIQEIYANLRQSDPSRDVDAVPSVNTQASNIAAQGYSVSVNTKNGSPTVSTTAVANDTVTGTIDKLNKRYYNQFTNTLTDAAAVNLAVTKHLQNYEWSGERYYVKLTDSESIYRFTDTQRYLSRASGTDDVTYTYASPLRFSEPGEYEFTFTEYDSSWQSVLSGTVGTNGVIYGEAVTVKVKVENVNGKLVVTGVTGGEFRDADNDGTNDTVVATITNKVLPISIYKIGNADANNKLSGVSFKLYSDEELKQQVTTDARGTAIGTDGVITTGTDGTARIGVLASGTYYLVETAPAPGYVALTDAVTITVADDGTISYEQVGYDKSKLYASSHTPASDLTKDKGGLFITGTNADGSVTGYTLTVNNTSGAELPKSGGVGTQLILAIGAGMIAAGALVLFNHRRGLIAL